MLPRQPLPPDPPDPSASAGSSALRTWLPRRWRWVPLAVAALLLAVGWWIQATVERAVQTRLAQHLATVLEANVTALEVWLDTQRTAAQALAGNAEIGRCADRLARLAREEELPPAELRECAAAREVESIVGAQIHAHGFEGFALYGAAGTGLAASRAELVGRPAPPEARPFVEAALAGATRVSPPFRSPLEIDGEPPPVLVVATPVRAIAEDGAGAVPGAVVAALVLRLRAEGDFARLLTVSRFGASGETYAFDRRGRLLSPSRFQADLVALGLLRPGADAAFGLRLADPGADLVAGYRGPAGERPLTRPVAAAVAGGSGVDVEGYRDYRGVSAVGAWTWLDEHGFGVVTEVDRREACRPLVVLQRALLGLFALLLLAYLGVLFASRSALLSRRRLSRAMRDAQRLGQYVLEERIGEGGMGAVYRASHVLLRRPTALKLLLPEKNSPRDLERFEREVRLTSGLTHPNTVAVYDYGRTPEGVFYYAMEYLPGIHLKDLVRRFGPVPEARAIQLLAQVCDSLAEAHAQGLVHRDIKPSNLMLCERGGLYDVVKVLDFGLVKETNDTKQLTGDDVLAGTPQYMPPEVAAGKPVDARGDLYSLGCVAYFLLAGEDVFQAGSAVAIVAQHVTAEPKPPSERLGRALSADLEAVVLACLAKDPGERPQSAEELRDLLAGCAQAGCWSQDEARAWWAEHGAAARRPREPVTAAEATRTRTVVVEIDRR